MRKNILKFFSVFALCFFCFLGTVNAETGTIDSTYFKTKLDLDDSVIYWRTTNGESVVVSDTAITGEIWGSTVGWIILDPVDGGVVNDGNGNLSGTAWGSVTGWINFGPFSNNATQEVTILDDGSFDGYAWSQTFGWIIFDCDVANACLRTDWGVEATTTGGGGGGGPTEDDPIDPPVDEPPVDDTPEEDPIEETPVEEEPEEEIPLPPTEPINNDIPTPPNPPSGGGDEDSPYVQIEDIIENFVSGELKPVSTLLTTLGFIAGALSFFTSLLLLDPALLSSIYTIPGKLSGLLFGGLWFRKRKPWGVVYDAITKQPIDPAYVVLYDTAGKEIATSITDLDGRYGFLTSPGIFSIVANKTNYIFPSKILSGRIEDEMYADLYFGGPISVSDKNVVINKNIPMDPVSFDWNEFAKREKGLMKSFQLKEKTIMRASEFMFFVGFIISLFSLYFSMTTYNIVIVALYVVLSVLRMFGFHMNPHGGITDASGKVVPFALIKFYQATTALEVAHKVTDKNGRYYCLIKNGTYYATIQEKLPDGSYSVPKKTGEFTITKGKINKVFEI